MLFGRAYRKFVAQLWAYIAYRWVAVWLLVAACSARGQAGEAAAFVIIAGDLSAGVIAKIIVGVTEDAYRKDWLDRLTNRMFYKLFWDQLVDGGARSVDVSHLFQQATKDAVADIKIAADDDKMLWGALDKTAWHWAGGVISFLWQWVAAILYYGSAWTVGHAG